MLSVRHLKKRYGDITALDDVTFDVKEGDILGFLGPNGAGKSTTMKIVTGFIPATSGTAIVDGIDVKWDSLEVRRRIGYLPENTPLYSEMRVEEYLNFRAKLKEVPGRARRKRVEEVMTRVKILDRRRQLIGTLSKGYRQRVGIADALVGDPKLLILDEPTIGLDPNQIRDVRSLIKELGERHTIVFSTHILQEVELVCDHVVIIASGRSVAQDTLDGLLRRFQEHSVRLALRAPGIAPEDAAKALESVSGVKSARALGRSRAEGEPEDVIEIRVDVDGGARDSGAFGRIRAASEALGKRVFEKGWILRDLSPVRTTLEDIYFHFTQDADVAVAASGDGGSNGGGAGEAEAVGASAGAGEPEEAKS